MWKVLFCMAIISTTPSIYVICNSNHKLESEKQNRITGGLEVKEGQFPSQVSIRNKNGKHLGGGSIIGKRWILTSAYCVRKPTFNPELLTEDDPSNFVVVAGEIDLVSLENAKHKRDVVYVEIYPDIKKSLKDENGAYLVGFDNALMRLATPFEYTDNIKAIDFVTTEAKEGTKCEIAGWGSIVAKEILDLWEPSDKLLYTNVIIKKLDYCNEKGIVRGVKAAKGTVCGASDPSEKAPCVGDSGAGLICNGKLTGVQSITYLCGLEYTPLVFGNVCRNTDWIKNHIKDYEGEHGTDAGVSVSSHKITKWFYVIYLIFILYSVGANRPLFF